MAALSECGRYPIFLRAMKQIWKFIDKCRTDNTNSLVKNAYIENCTLNLSRSKSVKFISSKVGIEDINSDLNIEMAHTNLRCKYLDFWKEKLFNDEKKHKSGNKLRT